MADQMISELAEETSPQNADVFAIEVDILSVPATKQITLANLITAINKPAGASGNVQFNSAGVFGGDNGLFWDNVNKRLGIGTTGPGAKLDVKNSATNDGIIIRSASDMDSYTTNTADLNFYDKDTGVGRIRMARAAGNQYSMGLWTNDLAGGGLLERVTVNYLGNVGIGTVSPTISDGIGLHLAGKILRIGTAKTPATAGAAGNAGEICWDANYMYLAIATNTWRRMTHATW